MKRQSVHAKLSQEENNFLLFEVNVMVKLYKIMLENVDNLLKDKII